MSRTNRRGSAGAWLWPVALLAACGVARAQTMPTQTQTPIAIAPIEGVQLTGGLDIADGKASIATSGSITAGEQPTTVTLPHRGNLRICATTKVSLTADASVPRAVGSGLSDPPGLMMALEQGALEASFATGKNSDVILTPDFRILISGPGVASVQVRLGPKGDTCVDNRGPNAPYVTVSSIFEGGVYRVQSDQRVMFQHGSLREVVDTEKESCGCPSESNARHTDNEFPLAQSELLAPAPKVPGNAPTVGSVGAQATASLQYDGTHRKPITATVEAAPVVRVTPEPAKPAASTKKSKTRKGFLVKVGHFFRDLFGG